MSLDTQILPRDQTQMDIRRILGALGPDRVTKAYEAFFDNEATGSWERCFVARIFGAAGELSHLHAAQSRKFNRDSNNPHFGLLTPLSVTKFAADQLFLEHRDVETLVVCFDQHKCYCIHCQSHSRALLQFECQHYLNLCDRWKGKEPRFGYVEGLPDYQRVCNRLPSIHDGFIYAPFTPLMFTQLWGGGSGLKTDTLNLNHKAPLVVEGLTDDDISKILYGVPFTPVMTVEMPEIEVSKKGSEFYPYVEGELVGKNEVTEQWDSEYKAFAAQVQESFA